VAIEKREARASKKKIVPLKKTGRIRRYSDSAAASPGYRKRHEIELFSYKARLLPKIVIYHDEAPRANTKPHPRRDNML